MNLKGMEQVVIVGFVEWILQKWRKKHERVKEKECICKLLLGVFRSLIFWDGISGKRVFVAGESKGLRSFGPFVPGILFETLVSLGFFAT